MPYYYQSPAQKAKAARRRVFWIAALGCVLVGSVVFGFHQIGTYQQRKEREKRAEQQAEQQRGIEEYWSVVRHNRRLEELQKAEAWVREENEERAERRRKSGITNPYDHPYSRVIPVTVEDYFRKQEKAANFDLFMAQLAANEKQRAAESPPMTVYQYEQARRAEEEQRAYEAKLRWYKWMDTRHLSMP